MNNSTRILWIYVFSITIDGSATVYPLSKAMGEAFQQGHPSVRS